MKEFNELGLAVERRWRERNYSEAVFPDLCADALRLARIPEKFDARQILEWTIAADILPGQQDLSARFGEPPITVFNGTRFFIDVYFWFEGTTAIHQHGFCGAFQVLHGSSLHSWYDFEAKRAINCAMSIGEINLRSCQLLNVGDVHRIEPGPAYIHSLFHLDHPSVTLIIRTGSLPRFQPQFEYRKPSLAIDPFFEDRSFIKKMQAVQALFRFGEDDGIRSIGDWLATADLHTSYQILLNLRGHFGSSGLTRQFAVENRTDRLEELLGIVERRHGDDAQHLREALRHQAQVDLIVRQRSFVTDAEHRFFLALLLNVEGRERIFELVRTRFPDADPLDKVLDWVFDLSQARVFGVDVPNALGIADFDDADISILECVLSGADRAATESRVAPIFGAAADASSRIREKYDRILDSPIFKPLIAIEARRC